MASSTLKSSQNGTTYPDNRPRSGTAASADGSKSERPVTTRPARPSHLRSRSYLSSFTQAENKPRNAATFSTETSPSANKNNPADKDASTLASRDGDSHINSRASKLHLPGHRSRPSHDLAQNGKDSLAPHLRSHMHVLTRANSHRHTKSDVPSRWSHITNTGSEIHLPGRNRSSTHLAPPDAPLMHPAVAAAKGGMLTRISSNLSGKNVGTSHKQPRHQYSASDFHKGRHPVTGAIIGAGTRPDIRRRATSDPRTPFEQSMRDGMGAGMAARYGVAGYIDGSIVPPQERRKPLTEVEKLLLRAEKARREEEANTTEADVQRLATQLAESRVDIQEQLADNTRAASSLMRRLDDAHEMLVSTASSLLDTISSFQNLCQQSEALIGNFEHRTSELDQGTRKLLAKHRKGLFDERGTKISALEERGRKAGDKAEEMSRRLENCRTVIRNFTEREQTKRRAWRGVILGTITGTIIIVLGLLLGFGTWWYRNYGSDVRHDVHEVIAMALDQKGLAGRNGHLNKAVRQRIRGHVEEDAKREVKVLDKVPDEVKVVLEDIARRHNLTNPGALEDDGASKTEQYTPPRATSDIDEERKLKKLFDKLEL